MLQLTQVMNDECMLKLSWRQQMQHTQCCAYATSVRVRRRCLDDPLAAILRAVKSVSSKIDIGTHNKRCTGIIATQER